MGPRARPNVVVITTHDTGRHLGCYGVNTVHTETIDAIAGDGCLFTNYFTTSPVCSPSRGAMMTGRYEQRNGLMGLVHSPWWWRFNPGERHLSHFLADAGYHTALFGVHHETAYPEEELCFHEIHSPGRESCLEVAQRAAAFIRSRHGLDEPFFAEIGFIETHKPYARFGYEPDCSKGVFVPPYLVDNHAARDDFAGLQGMVRAVDAAVATILGALEEGGHVENTLLVFTVDHGLEVPRAKWTCYDPGIEVALIMRWPAGGIAGGLTNDWLLSNVDFLPTVLDLIGEPLPDGLDGRSFAGAFRDQGIPPRERIYGMFEGASNRFVRTNRLKLIRSFKPQRLFETPADVGTAKLNASRPPTPYVQLYDLLHDPHEFTDLASEPAYADVLAELDAALWRWMEDVDDPLLSGPTPTPYYLGAVAGYQAWRRQG